MFYLLLQLVVVVFICCAAFSSKKDFVKGMNVDYMGNGENCPADGKQVLSDNETPVDFDQHSAMRTTSWLLFISFLTSFALGCLMLTAFQKAARVMVWATMCLKIVLPAVAGIIFLVDAGSAKDSDQANSFKISAIVCFVFASLFGLVAYLWRFKLELVAKLLSVSATGLKENSNLLGMTSGLMVINGLFGVLTISGMYAGYQHGNIVFNTDAYLNVDNTCVDRYDMITQVNCCDWQVKSWVNGYWALLSLSMLWTTSLLFEIRIFTIGSTIAQWYYASPGTGTDGNMRRALTHASGPSFGTLCLGSLILTIVQLIKQAANQRRQRNIVLVIIACIANCVASLVEYLTKFATLYAAISGDAFFSAGKKVTGVLKRNFLSSIAVFSFPGYVIGMGMFIISAFWACIMGFIGYSKFGADSQEEISSSVLLGVVSFFLVFIVLMFFGSVLLSCIDAVYICYALDLEQEQVTRQEFHEVFSLVPCKVDDKGVVIQQPSHSGASSYSYASQQSNTSQPQQSSNAGYYA